MSDETSPDLNFIAWQLRQVISDFKGFRKGLDILTVTSLRMDHTLSALLTEVRAMHLQQNGLTSGGRAMDGEH